MNNMLTPRELENHIFWTRTMWTNAGELNERDHHIITHGFPGETGEVMEVLQRRYDRGVKPEETRINLIKELGDVFYYWCMIVFMYNNRGLDNTGDFYADQLLGGVKKHEDHGTMYITLGFAASVGRVTEIFKKEIRDGGMDEDKLDKYMKEALEYWLALCDVFHIDPHEVLETNRIKIEDRHSRNVIRGEGDNR